MRRVAGGISALFIVVVVVALGAVVFYQMRPALNSASATGAPTSTPTEQVPSPHQTGSKPTDAATAVPCCESTEQPSTSPTALTSVAPSDVFWNRFAGIGLHWGYEYSGLADIVDGVDLIVVGTIVDVSLIERPHGPRVANYVQATVNVEEVLKGDLHTRQEGTVTVTLGLAGEDWNTVSSRVPGHRHLFFLFNDAADLIREGDPIPDPEYSSYTYWRPNDQAVLREIEGRVSVVGAEHMVDEYGPDWFPLPFNGTNFAELVEQVRLLASGL